METTKGFIKAVTVALVLAATSVAAHAEEFDNRTITVSFHDLDLSKSADASELLVRIRQGVKQVCSRVEGNHESTVARARINCQKATYAHTIATLKSRNGVDLESVAAHSSSSRAVAVQKQ